MPSSNKAINNNAAADVKLLSPPKLIDDQLTKQEINFASRHINLRDARSFKSYGCLSPHGQQTLPKVPLHYIGAFREWRRALSSIYSFNALSPVLQEKELDISKNLPHDVKKICWYNIKYLSENRPQPLPSITHHAPTSDINDLVALSAARARVVTPTKSMFELAIASSTTTIRSKSVPQRRQPSREAPTFAMATTNNNNRSKGIKCIGPKDVLMGRGVNFNKNKGNMRFRDYCCSVSGKYASLCNVGKYNLTNQMVQDMLSDGWRFLAYNNKVDAWFKVEHSEIRIKIAQRLLHAGILDGSISFDYIVEPCIAQRTRAKTSQLQQQRDKGRARELPIGQRTNNKESSDEGDTNDGNKIDHNHNDDNSSMNDNLTMVGDGIISDNNNDCNIDKNVGANDKDGVDSNNDSSNPSHDPIYDADTDEEGSIVPFACVSAQSVYDVETDDEGGTQIGS